MALFEQRIEQAIQDRERITMEEILEEIGISTSVIDL